MRQYSQEHSSSLSTEGYVRLIVIVGAYCMLRPYLVKLGGRFQAKDHAREVDDTTEETSPAAVSPNTLRGGADLSDHSSEDEQVESPAPRWGRGARQRQKRKAAQEVLDTEKIEVVDLDEEQGDSDKEIQEFLRKVIH